MTEKIPVSFPIHKADQCVMCGLCLPHCPTYEVYKTESESPRGRIALMQAMATGNLELTPEFETHLDHCLTCRACEKVCPAAVPYGELIDTTRAMINRKSTARQTRPETMLDNLSRLKRWRPLLFLYQHSGLQKAARTLRLPSILGLQQQEHMIPRLPKRRKWHEHYPATGKQCGQVALFTGCTGKILDEDTLAAAIKILTRLGYSVTIPADQDCCGILHQHSGYPDEAHELALNNINSFQADQLDAIIYIASGCGMQLTEYNNLPGLNQQQQKKAQSFSCKVQEISQFIMTKTWPDSISLSPLKKTVAVHTPCSLQNIRHHKDASLTLLKKIPQLAATPLPGKQLCCGAAGDYMLRHPDIASSLIKPKLKALEQLKPDFITTANIGCALHFKASLKKKGSAMEVIHPITLLARQIN